VHPHPTSRNRASLEQVAELYRGRQQQYGRGCCHHPAKTTQFGLDLEQRNVDDRLLLPTTPTRLPISRAGMSFRFCAAPSPSLRLHCTPSRYWSRCAGGPTLQADASIFHPALPDHCSMSIFVRYFSVFSRTLWLSCKHPHHRLMYCLRCGAKHCAGGSYVE
jgi:hypothetical protein